MELWDIGLDDLKETVPLMSICFKVSVALLTAKLSGKWVITSTELLSFEEK